MRIKKLFLFAHTPFVVLKDTGLPRQTTITVAPPEPNLTQRVLRTGCPFKGHPSRPQTTFKSSENLIINPYSKIKQDRRLG